MSAPALKDAVLKVDDLHVRFTQRTGLRSRRVIEAVKGVSFELARGETLGLVGESGCGKSTLVRTVFGLNPVASGSIEVLGRRLDTLSSRERRSVQNRMQLVFQDPYSALNPRLTAHEIVAEPLRIAGRYSRDRVVSLLDDVGLGTDALERRPGQFSGGQRQRIGIARALALEPDVLVLDEPVSALDVSVQAQVINLLKDLQAARGLSYLFIAHDLAVVRYLSDRVAVMNRGEFVEVGTRDQVFGAPAHPYTRSLLDSIPLSDPRQRPNAPAASPQPVSTLSEGTHRS
ncbi:MULTISPECIES: ATP-binding cassette domain-containing protein [unclassified Rathayibacter]|uniref:ATP-binding cassette domain-containing protein n=1 Tax=unclassified Rathayibacter TaxID=2609250 RepID=UPI001ABDC80B|nr:MULTISPECIES: ATP-binding cassette domain-containing protein [unclassified Rathayibacter]MCJ1674013.1 ATP-binding cassette domain-containing protein [Rathayibacter sp. VKM Ac-2929]MCJ1685187.1 ATP-binding cassette domain-containing protein [Rathayibacter sp. VKM Ac-2928]MCJ1689215.1 ATP-binding cassette domain-containing protein [Rathayibacter sp. VKM Ac-2927]